MAEVVRRLTAKGLCVKRSVNPSEEIASRAATARTTSTTPDPEQRQAEARRLHGVLPSCEVLKA
jgi:hypothetical protein